VIISLVVTSLGSASVERVGARDTDRLKDVVERDAAVIAAGGGARVALVLVQELVMARRTDHVPDRALYIRQRQIHHYLRACLTMTKILKY
jgi:hypothetical protein